MRHNIYPIAAAFLAMAGLTACDKESTFFFSEGEGQLDCSSLSVDYINSGNATRAAGVKIGDFTVDFVSSNGNVAKSYIYSQMPEVVALPVGDYTIKARYGDNPVADWEAPYYLGTSASSFSIKAGKITTDIDPVECALSNIRISVNIDDLGLGILGEDVKVEVRVGNQGKLTYTRKTNDRSGYFRYITDSETITAVFSGTVDGVYVDGITRAYNNAAEGNYYAINFTITRPDELEDGSIQIGNAGEDGIYVDATISVRDENIEIDPDEPNGSGNGFEDWRPMEDPSGNPDTPPVTPPDDPNDDPNEDPTPSAKGPQIIIKSEGLKLNEKTHVDILQIGTDEKGEALYYLAFDVTSQTGITEFKIVIDSSTLTPDELDGVGLSDKLDLINPGEYKPMLVNLGFPVEDEVKGQTSCEFDISKFIPLLNILGSGTHSFNLTISDAEGTTKGAIIIEN